jgi:BASS family bile acid:Na+ symporter
MEGNLAGFVRIPLRAVTNIVAVGSMEKTHAVVGRFAPGQRFLLMRFLARRAPHRRMKEDEVRLLAGRRSPASILAARRLNMEGHGNPLARFSHFLHRNFIWFLMGSYGIAALAPKAGLWIKEFALNDFVLFGIHIHFPLPIHVSLPMLLLALLLLNAGLGVEMAQLRHLLRRPWVLAAGLAANLFLPIAYIFAVSQTMRVWHNPEEVQNILVGLALVASMPIAGSSTAWSQNANGDLTMSLGLVLFSTLLSPLTTPLALHSVGLMTTGDYSEDLHELAATGTGGFLAACVILPSILGILIRGVAGPERIGRAKPTLKLLNSLNLLVLNYSNASVSLPESIANPDPDFVSVLLVIVSGLCAFAFAAGWLLARLFRTDLAQRTSLMFGLGMNNNGTGLVLATMALADHPRVMLPIIFYNLVQHLVAGCVDYLLFRRSAAGAE